MSVMPRRFNLLSAWRLLLAVPAGWAAFLVSLLWCQGRSCDVLAEVLK